MSNWVFESPVSYWDRHHGAMWIAPAEAMAATISALALWHYDLGWKTSVTVTILLAAELWIVRQWLFYFIDG